MNRPSVVSTTNRRRGSAAPVRRPVPGVRLTGLTRRDRSTLGALADRLAWRLPPGKPAPALSSAAPKCDVIVTVGGRRARLALAGWWRPASPHLRMRVRGRTRSGTSARTRASRASSRTIARRTPRTSFLVWAVDTRHLPLYWFPRECPRGTFWAHSRDDGRRRRPVPRGRPVAAGARDRVVVARHAFRCARVYAYRLPPEPFEPYPPAGGYWIAREPVEPLELVAVGDLAARHAKARDRAPLCAEAAAALGPRDRLVARVQRDPAAQPRSVSRAD